MSTLQVYNTLSRSKETFKPLVEGKVGMYVCGPTVYDYFHIGNARTFSVFDMVARWLRASGYDVTYVRNITDVEDKIMKRAAERGEDIGAFTARMIAALDEDCARLGLAKPDREPRATRYIPEMLEIIATLEKKGLAYRASDGDVNYAVRKFPGYGKLSRRNLDEMRAGERVSIDATKQDPLDFVLWKAAKPGEPSWDSTFGPGRPGWHIECSAMSCKELGIPFDIHGGGWDLQFPHHENEIAQSEGSLDRPFVRYWMHSAFLNIDHEKMSKSLGNFRFTRDVLDRLDKRQGPEQLRYFLLHGHYRKELDHTESGLNTALSSVRGLYTALKEGSAENVSIDWSDAYAAAFQNAMNDDFDTPAAFAVLHALRSQINQSKSARLAGLLKGLGGTIGLLQDDPVEFLQGSPRIVEGKVAITVSLRLRGELQAKLLVAHPSGEKLDVAGLIDERKIAKTNKDYARSDEIRRKLEEAGIVLEDKPGGVTEWRRK